MGKKKYKQADLAFDRQQFHEATRLLRQLVKHEPSEPLFRWKLGYALSEMKDYRGAIRECQQALKLDPQKVAALGCLGRAYMELGAWTEAETAIRERLSLKKCPQHCVFLAHILMQLARYDEA